MRCKTMHCMASETRDCQLTVRIPRRIRDALGLEADGKRRTLADIVNNALANRYPAASDGAASGETSSDVAVFVSLDVAEVVGAFLPANERLLRNSDLRSMNAVSEFKRAVMLGRAAFARARRIASKA